MTKSIGTVLACVLACAAVAGVAAAQTGDAVPDGNGHPDVGALLMPGAGGDLEIICTGTLVTPRVFLTASHCTASMERSGLTRAFVSFDPDFGTDSGVTSTPYAGRIVTNPAYRAPYQRDVSLVLLDAAVTSIAPAQLAPRRFLDDLKATRAIRGTEFVNVGYGSSEQVVVPGAGPVFPFDGIREVTTSGFHSLDRRFIHLDQNLARGYSGTGYGDSGGPTFVETATGPVVVSIVSTGDAALYATSVNTRVDTDEARAFLAPYLAMR